MLTYIKKQIKRIKFLYLLLRSINSFLQNTKELIKSLPIFLKEFFISIFDRRIRINVSHWSDHINEEWVQNFYLNSYLPEKYSNFRYSPYRPFISYFSVFGSRNAIEKCKSPIKIFVTGEDVENNFTDYKDECINSVDLSLGFTPKYKKKDNNYIRYPLWIFYYFEKAKNKDEIKKIVDSFNAKQVDKNKFCCLVASHDRSGIRSEIVNLLSSIDNINCGDRIFHNDDTLKTDYDDNKIKYLEQFIFNICPENTNVDGYVTEKLFQSFDACCIPIYNGGGDYLEPEVINKNAIIYYDTKNKDQLIEQVKELYTNKKYYQEFIKQQRLLPECVDYIYKINTEVQKHYDEIFRSKGLL